MFSSLKIKTFFFLTLLMTTTAGVIIIFTHRDVGDAMLKAERSSATNILELVELNIKAGYEVYDIREILLCFGIMVLKISGSKYKE